MKLKKVLDIGVHLAHIRRNDMAKLKRASKFEKTNLTLDPHVKRAAVKLAYSRNQSLSYLVAELLQKKIIEEEKLAARSV